MKLGIKSLILISFFALLAYQNCAKVKFSSVTEEIHEASILCACTQSELDHIEILSSAPLTSLHPNQTATFGLSTLPSCLGSISVIWNTGVGAAISGDNAVVTYGAGANTLKATISSDKCSPVVKELNLNLSWPQCDPSVVAPVINAANCAMTPAGTSNCRSKKFCQADGTYGICQYEALTSGYVTNGNQCVLQGCACGSKIVSGACQSDGVTRTYPNIFDPATHKEVQKICSCSAPAAASPPWAQTSADDYARMCYQRWTGNCDTANGYYVEGNTCKKFQWVSTGECSVSSCGQTGSIAHECKKDGVTVSESECTSRGLSEPYVSCSSGPCFSCSIQTYPRYDWTCTRPDGTTYGRGTMAATLTGYWSCGCDPNTLACGIPYASPSEMGSCDAGDTAGSGSFSSGSCTCYDYR